MDLLVLAELGRNLFHNMSAPATSPGPGRHAYLLLICFVASLGGLLFGFDTAVISGAQPLFTARFALHTQMEGFVTSSAIIGCFFGALAAGFLTDRFGRKKVLLLAAILFAASAIWCWYCQGAWELVCARLVGGLGIGIASLASPLYIAEVSPPASRGRLVALQQLAIVLGILAAFFSNSLINSITPEQKDWMQEWGWRWMLLVAVVPSVLFGLLIFPLPESPRWLTKQGSKEQARAILTRLAGEENARAEMAQIEDAIAHEGGSFLELLKPGLRMALFIGVTLAIFTQITGINAIMYYAPKVFTEAGFGQTASYWSSVLVGLTNLVFTLLSMAVVDRLGRKALLLIGSACMLIALTSVGYSFYSSSLFTERDLKNPHSLAAQLLPAKADPVSAFVRGQFSPDTMAVLATATGPNCETNRLRTALVNELNRLLKNPSLFAPDRFAGLKLSEETAALARLNPQGEQLARLNRMLLEAGWPGVLPHKANHRGINGYEMLLGVLAYVASFAFSMGVVGWVLISEIYPTRTRGRAMSLATSAVWAGCFLVSLTFPMLVDWKGPLGESARPELAFWLYAAMCVLAVLFIWRFVPETKGRSLEEIETSWVR
jgi:MFS transporter, SP family, arabinose:H+ symporter